MKSTFPVAGVVVALAVFAAGCHRSEPVAPASTAAEASPTTLMPGIQGKTAGSQLQLAGDDIFAVVNSALAADGAPYRLALYETITSPGSGEFGATVFAKNVGNKQLVHHFVSGDPRRGGRTNITYIVDMTEGSTTGGLGNAQTEPSIDNAMQTWNQEACAPLIQKVALGFPLDLGYIQFLLGFGGVAGWAADITHGGWLPAAFFEAIQPGGSTSILGVTFTLLWVDGSGNFTDIDGDGKFDVAFRDIYYNNAFSWSVASPAWNDPQIDVESIALHEAGHGLSQGHFGKVFFDGKGTQTPTLQHLHFSPRAVMNALYWETQRELLGTDRSGHCSIWSSWQY